MIGVNKTCFASYTMSGTKIKARVGEETHPRFNGSLEANFG